MYAFLHPAGEQIVPGEADSIVGVPAAGAAPTVRWDEQASIAFEPLVSGRRRPVFLRLFRGRFVRIT